MKAATLLLAIGLTLLTTGLSALATLRYVDANSTTPMPPYTNWAGASRILQHAVDAANPGDEIVVTNGIYAFGGRAAGYTLKIVTNRLAVTKPLTVRSVNGPQFTVIQGDRSNWPRIRCVYLASGASLSGFTLTNGATQVLSSFLENSRNDEFLGGGQGNLFSGDKSLSGTA